MGPNYTAAAGPPTAFGIACWSEAEDGGSLNSSVDVRLGAELNTWLNSSSTGGGGGGGGGGPAAHLTGVRLSQREPVANSSSDGGGGSPDWGLTIVGLPRLRLVNSVISDLPLSPAGPLLEVLGCEELSLQNVTLSGLTAQAPGAFGAVRAAGSLRRAAVHGMRCHDVRGASGWACLLLSAEGTSGSSEGGNTADSAGSAAAFDVSITDSSFSGNTVVGPAEAFGAGCSVGGGIGGAPPGITGMPPTSDEAPPGIGGQTKLGFGAVLFQPRGGSVHIALHNTTLRANAGGCGGALALAGPLGQVLLELDASLADGNSATWGGAFAVLPSSAAAPAAAAAVRISLANGSRLSSNTAEAGGGAMFVSGAETSLSLSGRSSIALNRALSGSGGALLLTGGMLSGLDLADAALDGNAAPLGSGGAVSAAWGLVDSRLHNSSLSHNTALSGGALFAGGAVRNLTVSGGSKVANNSALMPPDEGAAVLLEQDAGYGGVVSSPGPISLVTIRASAVYGNRASYSGGAIFSGDSLSDVDVTDASLVYGNQATGVPDTDGKLTGGDGGFAATWGYLAGVSFRNSTRVWANTAAMNGGVLQSEGPAAGISFTTGSVFYENFATSGGVLHVLGDLEGLEVSGACQMHSNAAVNRGGVFCVGGSLLNLAFAGGSSAHLNKANWGGVLFVSGSAANISVIGGSSAWGNNVTSGGGFTTVSGSLAGFSIAGGSKLYGNAANKSGAVIYVYGNASEVSITGNSSVYANRATSNGGVLFVNGGLDGLVISESGTLVAGNEAGGNGGVAAVTGSTVNVAIASGAEVSGSSANYGGALFLSGSVEGFSVLNGSRVGGNAALVAGGVLYTNGNVSAVRISNSSVQENLAAWGGVLYLAKGSLAGLSIISNSTVWGNAASGNGKSAGGVVYVAANLRSVEISGGSLVRSNLAGLVGGVFCAYGSIQDVTLTSSSQIWNSTAQYGGVLYGAGEGSGITISGGTHLYGNTVNGSGGVLYVSGKLSGFAVTGNSSIHHNQALWGGALYVAEGSLSNVLISGASRVWGNVATGASSSAGGAVSVPKGSLSDVLISAGSSIDSNYASWAGGALYAGGDAWNVTLESAALWNNSAPYGGALHTQGRLSSFSIRNSASVYGNKAAASGGVLYSTGGVSGLSVTANSSVYENGAPYGGVLFTTASIDGLTISDSRVWSNTAIGDRQSAGGFVAAVGSLTNLLIQDSDVWGHEAGYSGGVLDAGDSSSNIRVENSRIRDNAAQFGGVLNLGGSLLDGVVVTRGSQISFNYANISGGVISTSGSIRGVVVEAGSQVVNNSAAPKGRGGVLYAAGNLTGLSVEKSTLSANQANVGSVIYTFGSLRGVSIVGNSTLAGNTAVGQSDASGGAIFVYGSLSDFLVANSSVSSNMATSWGGVVYCNEAATNISIEAGSVVTNNTSGWGGGFLYAFGSVQSFVVTGSSELSWNSAEGGSGGVLFSKGPLTRLRVENGSRVHDNYASGNGAVVAAQSISDVAFSDAQVHGNTAVSSGGTLSVPGSLADVSVRNCSFGSNSANYGGLFGASGAASNISIAASTLSHNLVAGSGILVGAQSISNLTISETSIWGNVATSGRGGLFEGTYMLTGTIIQGCTLYDNEASATLLSSGIVEAARITDSDVSASRGGLVSAGYSASDLQLVRLQISSTAWVLYGGNLSAVTVRSCQIRNMSSGAFVAGVNIDNFSLLNTTISDTQSNLGSVMYSAGSLSAFLGNTSIANASASVDGGAFASGERLTLVLEGSTVSNASAGRDGGLASAKSLSITLRGSTISGCAAVGNGGAIFAAAELTDLDLGLNSALQGCRAAGAGGVVYAARARRISLSSGSSVASSRSGLGNGGCVFTAGALEDLSLTDHASLIKCTAPAAMGGAVYVGGNAGSMSFAAGSLVSGNTATWGGAVFVGGNLSALSLVDGGMVLNNTATSGSGGSIAVAAHAGSLTVSGASQVVGNAALRDGGWLYVAGGSIAVRIDGGSALGWNSAGASGGAIALLGPCGRLVLNGSTLVGNRAGANGGAIAAASVGGRSVVACNVSANSAGLNGGGLYLEGLSGRLEVSWSTFEGNAAAVGRGGSLYVSAQQARTQSAAGLSIEGTLFRSSTAGSGGGGLFVNVSSAGCAMVDATAQSCPIVTLRNTSFLNCAALGGDGGGLAATLSGPSLALTACRFEGSSAELGRGGGAFVASTARTAVADTDFVSNFAAAALGGGGGGGGLAWSAAEATTRNGQLAAARLEVSGCLFSNNSVRSGSQGAAGQSAGSGGGLLAAGSSAAGLSAAVVFSSSSFEGNFAPSGAGVSVMRGSAATVLNCSFDSNQAASTGGGLLLQGVQQAWLEHVGFTSNAAAVGGGLHVSTDASQQQTSTARRLLLSAPGDSKTLLLVDFLFANNTASRVSGPASPTLLYAGYGGGIFLSQSVAAALINGSFQGNSASKFGPGVATLQDMGSCSRGDQQQGNTTSEARPPNALGQGPYARTVAALTDAAARGCWGLALYDVDPISAGNSTSVNGSSQSSRRRDRFLWVRDPSASAISAGCTSQPTAATNESGTAASGVAALVTQASGPQNSTALARLASALQQCSAAAADGGQRSASVSAFIGLPPTNLRLWLDNASAVEAGQVLQRTPGGAGPFRVELVDASGQRATDHPAASASLSFGAAVALPAGGGSFGALQSTPTGAVPLYLGLAAWEAVLFRGWTGSGYRLNVTVAFSDACDTTLIEVTPLSLDVELLPCPIGSSVDPGPAGHPQQTSCQPCRPLQFSLWVDPRNSSNAVESFSNDMLADILEKGVCEPCPSETHCPGGAVVVPQPGYWHSAANSTLIHRCFSEDACTPPSPPVAANATAVAADVSTALVACQQAWYASQPPGARVLAAFNASSPDSTCLLWDSGPGYAAATSYSQLECAPGYHGHLCATCNRGSYLSPDFSCQPCPSQAATAVLGAVGSLATTALILFTAWTTYNADLMRNDTGEVAASDKLSVLITHMQYLIIVTGLNLGWPDVINKLTSALSSLTGATAFTFSATCLFSGLDPAGQAQAQHLWTLLSPIGATALAMALWSLRYALFNQSLLRRGGQSKMATKHRRQWSYNAATGGEPARDSVEEPLAGAPGDGSDEAAADEPHPNLAVGRPVHDPAARDPSLRPAVAPSPSLAASHKLKLGASLLPVTPSAHSDSRKPGAAAAPAGSVVPSTQQQPSASASAHFHPGHALSSRESTANVHKRSPHSPLHLHQLGSLGALGSALTSRLSSVTSSVQSTVREVTTVQPNAAIVHMDQAVSLPRQLRVVLLVATSILYPALAQVSLSTFACRALDTGEGPYSETQQATWRYGYWLSNMDQECYRGSHLAFYTPLGIVSVIIFCALPPVAIAVLLWCKRGSLDQQRTRAMYGFLYNRYRPQFYFFESVKQVEVLMLVIVDVFANAIYQYQQALLLLCVLLCIGVVNMSCRALRAKLLVLLEYLSLMVLALSITLGLFFVGGGAGSEMGLDSQVTEDAVAILIIVLNAGLLLAFALHIAWPNIMALGRLVTTKRLKSDENAEEETAAAHKPEPAASGSEYQRVDSRAAARQKPHVHAAGVLAASVAAGSFGAGSTRLHGPSRLVRGSADLPRPPSWTCFRQQLRFLDEGGASLRAAARQQGGEEQALSPAEGEPADRNNDEPTGTGGLGSGGEKGGGGLLAGGEPHQREGPRPPSAPVESGGPPAAGRMTATPSEPADEELMVLPPSGPQSASGVVLQSDGAASGPASGAPASGADVRACGVEGVPSAEGQRDGR
ncbi:hypothetical protein HYH03_014348 [Edaphochlamys debaryana]|uniref:Uncharacterized protein n=1 Tax=Edaphochlamys debaryana TaxID=47281 RepID=A0A835XNY8_9CHLO|nr:hypothetical protein HYH03_014348 [Edaphochlamys debaryana]|eukprot:KAG2486975.1 hypothetical protein HYH03_014348 [Edaphochlamys debaryana]